MWAACCIGLVMGVATLLTSISSCPGGGRGRGPLTAARTAGFTPSCWRSCSTPQLALRDHQRVPPAVPRPLAVGGRGAVACCSRSRSWRCRSSRSPSAPLPTRPGALGRGGRHSGCRLIGRFLGRERRGHIAHAWKGVSAWGTVLRSPASGFPPFTPMAGSEFSNATRASERRSQAVAVTPAAAADARNPFVDKSLHHHH